MVATHVRKPAHLTAFGANFNEDIVAEDPADQRRGGDEVGHLPVGRAEHAPDGGVLGGHLQRVQACLGDVAVDAGDVAGGVVLHLASTGAEEIVALVELALQEGGETCDNVTAIAMEWESADAPERSGTVMTRTLGEEVFASTIQAGVLDTSMEDLDDAAIERSIAEINEAIRRSAARKT